MISNAHVRQEHLGYDLRGVHFATGKSRDVRRNGAPSYLIHLGMLLRALTAVSRKSLKTPSCRYHISVSAFISFKGEDIGSLLSAFQKLDNTDLGHLPQVFKILCLKRLDENGGFLILVAVSVEDLHQGFLQ